MFKLDAKLAVYRHRDAIDFRKSVNGLAALGEAGGMDPPAAGCHGAPLEQLHGLLDGIDIEAVRRHPARQ